MYYISTKTNGPIILCACTANKLQLYGHNTDITYALAVEVITLFKTVELDFAEI